MSARTFFAFLAVCAVLGLLVFGLLSKGTTKIAVGEPVPDKALPVLGGSGTGEIADYRGKWVLVNLWASWCIPCRDEFPLFVEALQKYGTDGLAMVGVGWPNDDDAAAREFVASHAASWPTVTDHGGGCGLAWTAVAPPQTYFIGRDGVIASRQIGQVSQADFERQLAAILK